MLDFSLRMELLSDLCPASGDGFAGYVDTDVCFDGAGLPYIPAKRLKGCLRECGLDIISVDAGYAPVFDELFGVTGQFIPGGLKLGDGKLENYAQIADRIGDAYASELAEVFTAVRSRTRMENGKAAAGTLRTARVLPKGQVYLFPAELPERARDFFEMCVKALRGIGLNRSRGLGEVKCTLLPGEAGHRAEFKIHNRGETSWFSYSLELLRPVISAHRSGKAFATEDYIFGSAVLGAFAVKYIAMRGLDRGEAYQDADFRRLFLEGGLTFTAALPSFADGVYYPAPLVLRTDKLKTRLCDETDETLEVCDGGGAPADSAPPVSRRLGGFVLIETDGTVRTLSPAKTTFAHHARPADRSCGHATAQDGEFFTYEALSAGQTFIGSVIGSGSDVETLASLLGAGGALPLGRSRTAQYGLASVSPVEEGFSPNRLTLVCGDVFRLVAVTPVILEDASGVNRPDPGLIQDALGADYEMLRSVCAETVVGGYYGKWLLPERQLRALAEGSTVVFKYHGEGTALELDFIGARSGKGFGQIRLEKDSGRKAWVFAPENAAAQIKQPCALPEVKSLRVRKQAVTDGAKYGEKDCFNDSPKNATLARILTALHQAGNYADFARLICGIKQPKQKIAALMFSTGQGGQYFQTDPRRLESDCAAELLEQNGRENGRDYGVYQIYLNAAAQRIKEKRRGAADGKGGTCE